MVTTTPMVGLMNGQREPTPMGRVEIATPNLPVSGQRAEMANVENSSPNGPNIACSPLVPCSNDNDHHGREQCPNVWSFGHLSL
jgi:hypothetical protein